MERCFKIQTVLCCPGNQRFFFYLCNETTGYIKNPDPIPNLQQPVMKMERRTPKGIGKTVQENPDQEPATSASQLHHTGDGQQCYVSSVGENTQFGHGKLPPISTFFNKLPLSQGGSAVSGRAEGGVKSETVPSGCQVREVKPLPSAEHALTGRLDVLKTLAAGEPLSSDPVHVADTSPSLGGTSGALISFTIPPTEEGTVSTCGICQR